MQIFILQNCIFVFLGLFCDLEVKKKNYKLLIKSSDGLNPINLHYYVYCTNNIIFGMRPIQFLAKI